MGYWTNTTYLNTGDMSSVVKCLTGLFEAEGMRKIPRPSLRERMWYEPLQYDTALKNNLWGVALFPGTQGWIVIKTAPLELLAERAPGSSRMRLVDLCNCLRAPGFQINVYDSTGCVLVETDGDANLSLSGLSGSGQNLDPLRFYDEALDPDRIDIRFEWLSLQHMAEKKNDFDFAQSLERLLGGENVRYCDNITSLDTLICHKRFEAKEGQDLYFEWPAQDRSEPPRRSWEEIQQERTLRNKVSS
jgi:hypothetical protein